MGNLSGFKEGSYVRTSYALLSRRIKNVIYSSERTH